MLGGHTRVSGTKWQLQKSEIRRESGEKRRRSQGYSPDLMLHSRLSDDGSVSKRRKSQDCRKSEPGLTQIFDITNLLFIISGSVERFHGISREPVITAKP